MTMMMPERQMKILNIIQNNGSVEVEELARELAVSTMTIRRDLEKMHKEGLVERCHGGAVSRTEVAYAEKSVKNHEQKEKIAELCIRQIHSGTTVFLDAGTTTYEIASRMINMDNMTVVTNDLEIALLLQSSKAELILCGGHVQKSTGSTIGYYAMQMMDDFRFDAGFFGAAAINDEFQVMTPTVDKAFFKRQLARQCEHAYLAADSSKFHKQGMNRINDLSDYAAVITDNPFTNEETSLLDRLKVKLIHAE